MATATGRTEMTEASAAPGGEEKALTEQINETVLIRELPVGTRIKVRGGAIAEVTANPQDGGWLFIRYVESPDPAKVGEEDMVFCVDVLNVV